MKKSTRSSTRIEAFVDTSGLYALLVKLLRAYVSCSNQARSVSGHSG
jgi:hypothetical protein